MDGHGPLEVAPGRLGPAEGRGQQAQVMVDGTPEGDRHPDDRGPGGQRGERVVQPLAGRARFQGGGQLAREGGGQGPAPVGREPRRGLAVQQRGGHRLGGGAVAPLQQDQGQQAAALRRVVPEDRPHLREQLGAAALEAAELPELRLLDVGHVGLADRPAEVGRLRGQPFGLVEPAGQQRLGRPAGQGGIAKPRLPQVRGHPQELGQLALEPRVGQLEPVGGGQQPGLGQQLRVLAAGQLGDPAGQGQPVGRVLWPPAGVVPGDQAGGEGGPVAGAAGGRHGVVGEP